jgi:G patch domain-containing protein 1
LIRYFNTVGSKEGWTPQTFVSSRTNRAKAQQKAEDFMDDEDIADAEEAQKLETSTGFSGLGSTAEEASKRDVFMDLALPAGETMGVKLLQRMGWRPGQGVGPKVQRKARLAEEGDASGGAEEMHLFAPENSKMIGFLRKDNQKGLGYTGETSLSSLTDRTVEQKQEEEDDDSALSFRKPKLLKGKGTVKKSGLGVGILNDTGSDDEDPYEIGPKISYNRTIGGDKKAKKTGAVKTPSSNPLLAARPVFMSKKDIARKSAASFRKCHDGRLPLDGFILSSSSIETSAVNKYAPPKIPEGWKSSKTSSTTTIPSEKWQSTADTAKTSTLDPKARAAMLGEAALPGKSAFDFLTPAARDRLAAISGRKDLPQGKGEAPPEGYRKSEADKQKHLWSLVPSLDKELALGALQRGISGWMPYAEDEGKRARYRSFLELRAELRDALPERAPKFTIDDWKNELNEFAQAAQVFRPMTGMMASRFTSSSSTFEGSMNPGGKESTTPLLSRPTAKLEDPAEAAAKIGMYGPMTRSVLQFYPTRLVCKRFNVQPPSSVQIDPGTNIAGDVGRSSNVPDIVSKSAMEQILQEAAQRRFASGGTKGSTPDQPPFPTQLVEEKVVDVERNEALEAERPGEAVFRAIFGSDDEDDDR